MDQTTHQAVALLEAATRLIRLSYTYEIPRLWQEIVNIAGETLGVERVRLYVPRPDEGVLCKEVVGGTYYNQAVNLSTPCPWDSLPLERTNLLGRIALTSLEQGSGRTYVLRIHSLSDSTDTPEGIPTCFAPILLQPSSALPWSKLCFPRRKGSSLLGILVADYPQTREEITPCTECFLGLLAQLAALAIERVYLEGVPNQFVASVSHEIRAPLTSVAAFCEMLLDGDAGPLNNKQLRFLERIAAGSAQLQKIVEDLLELSRLRLRADGPAKDKVWIKPFLQDTALNFLPQTQASQVTISVVAPDDLPPLITDQRRLQQALSNLIDNAIKYSPAGGEVRLAAEMRDGQVWFSVSDNGPGIDPEDQPHLFKEFYRCRGRVKDKRDGGTGLGLAIVAQIAEILGAEVQVESQPGVGSRFILRVNINPETQDTMNE